MAAEPKTQQLRFDKIVQAKHKSSARKPKPKGMARGEFEPVAPPDLTQESSLWLTGQRSVEAQRGKRYVKAGIKHPGKMQPDVAGAAIDTYTKPGDHIVDCMGGQGTTGVEGAERGRHVTVIELVKHWVNVAYANEVRTAYRGAPGTMRVICGDARRLPQLLAEARAPDAMLTSPWYGAGHIFDRRDVRNMRRLEGRTDHGPQYDAALMSPPYGDTNVRDMPPGFGLSVPGGHFSDAPRGYDAALVSPPYGPTQTGRGMALEGINGDGRPPVERGIGATYDVVVTSPVYGESRIGSTPSGVVFDQDAAGPDVSNLPRGYDAVVTSPPYGDVNLNPGLTHGLHFGRDPEDVDKKKARQGQTPEGYDAVVASPPYGEALPEKGTNIGNGWGRCKSMVQMSEGYTPADAVITSPAYGDIRQDGGGHQFGDRSAMTNYSGEARVKGRTSRDRTNIGNLKYGSMAKALALVARLKAGEEIPESEWAAMEYLECMALIYWHCLSILRLGGLCILVLKDYRRDKRRVDLIGDTTVLMKAVGFVFHDKALALTSKVEDGRVISKVSPFVRVNARKPEKNGGPVLLPAGEEVLVFRKE